MKKFSRRSLLGCLGLSPVIIATFARAEYEDRTPQFSKEDKGIIYRGYRMFFTGWKESQGTDLVVGQWIGYPVYPGVKGIYRLDGKYPYLYSSVPGTHGPFLRGDCFNISIQDNQSYVNWKTASAAEREKESNKAKPILMKMIDVVMDSGLTDLKITEWSELLYKRVTLSRKPWTASFEGVDKTYAYL